MHGRQAGTRNPAPLALGVLALLLHATVAQAAGGPKIAIVYGLASTTGPSDLKTRLDATTVFSTVDVINAGSTAPTLATLKNYDALLVMGDYYNYWYDAKNTENAIVQYLDSGGGAVVAAPSVTNVFTGDFYTKYNMIDNGSMTTYYPASLGTKAVHPVMNGVGTINVSAYYCQQRAGVSSTTTRNGGQVVASWATGNGMVIVGQPSGRQVVLLNMHINPTLASYGCVDYTSNPDAVKLLSNALNYVANPLRSSPNPVDFGEVGVGVTAPSKAITITNAGMTAITIASASVGTSTEFSVSGLSGSVTLGAGMTTNLTVGFTPEAAGPRTGSLTLTPMGASSPPLIVSLKGTGIGPKLGWNPDSVDFGGVKYGSMVKPTTVYVRNVGGGQLQLESLTVADTTNFALDNLPTLPNVLSASAAQTFDVKFTPTSKTKFSTTVAVKYYLLPDTTTLLSASIPVTGSAGDPKIVAPGAVTLQSVRVGRTSMDQYITIQNTGFANLSIDGATFSGGAMGEFAVMNAPTKMNPLVILPSKSDRIRVQYTPAMAGKRSATLTITSDDSASPSVTVAVSGAGLTATYSNPTTSLAYGDMSNPGKLGACPASSKNIVITNTGDDKLQIKSLTFTGANASSFKTSVATPAYVLGFGGTLTIPVNFCPQETGALTAKLEISTDLTATHVDTVSLSGYGAGPKAVLNPSTVDFGGVFINQSKTKTVTITNNGNADLVFSGTPMMPSPPFSVTGLPSDKDVLKSGASITLTVSVRPTAPPTQNTGTLSIGSNDLLWPGGTIAIPLVVNGTQGSISTSADQLLFPATSVGAKSPDQDLVVTNNGSLPLTGMTVQLTGDNGNEFSVTPVPPTSLDPMKTFTFKVAFRPNGASVRKGTLAINAVGLLAPSQVKLEGTGKPVTVSCNPSALDFKNVSIGMSVTKSVKCTNSDTSPVSISTLFEYFQDDWSVAAAGTMIPGATDADGLLQLDITFKPTEIGARTSDLQIKSADSGLTLATIDLDGNGVKAATPDGGGGGGGGGGCSVSTGPSSGAGGAFALALLLLGVALRRRQRIQA